AEVADVFVIDRRAEMRLEADLVEEFRQQKLFVQKVPVCRSAISLVGDSNIELSVDINADPLFRSESLSHRTPVCIRNIIAAAEHDQPLAILQYLRDDR